MFVCFFFFFLQKKNFYLLYLSWVRDSAFVFVQFDSTTVIYEILSLYQQISRINNLRRIGILGVACYIQHLFKISLL